METIWAVAMEQPADELPLAALESGDTVPIRAPAHVLDLLADGLCVLVYVNAGGVAEPWCAFAAAPQLRSCETRARRRPARRAGSPPRRPGP